MFSLEKWVHRQQLWGRVLATQCLYPALGSKAYVEASALGTTFPENNHPTELAASV